MVSSAPSAEAKGAVAGYLTDQARFDGMTIRVGGPNAGHSVYGRCPAGGWRDESTGLTSGPVCDECNQYGHPWRLRQTPVTAVTNPEAILAVAAGSEVDLDVLVEEVAALHHAGYDPLSRLVVDPMATILERHHRDQEAMADLTRRVGSTGKGIGAARSSRIMRVARTVRDVRDILGDLLGGVDVVRDVAELAHRTLIDGREVLVEAAQGYGLGLHTGFYPQTTSGDCRAIDALAAAGISPWSAHVNEFEVWVVYRPYPIRVAGNSGPLWGETTWDALGLPAEQTTVTRKTRRVGTWDPRLAWEAFRANGGNSSSETVRIALTMADQVDPDVAGVLDPDKLLASDKIRALMAEVAAACGVEPLLVGTSPTTIVDLRG